MSDAEPQGNVVTALSKVPFAAADSVRFAALAGLWYVSPDRMKLPALRLSALLALALGCELGLMSPERRT